MDDDSIKNAGLSEAPVELAPRQMELHKALGEHHRNLAMYYEGALVALTHNINPDRLSQAAQSVRELMEKLPQYENIEMRAHQESLGAKVNEFRDAWQAAREASDCFVDGSWDGAIDKPARNLLERMDTLLEWFVTHHPRRREELIQLLTRLDPTGGLPRHLQDSHVSEWSEMRNYFVNLAHHRFATTSDEFRHWLSRLESFLLLRLVPQTSEDFAEIDKVIEDAGARP